MPRTNKPWPVIVTLMLLSLLPVGLVISGWSQPKPASKTIRAVEPLESSWSPAPDPDPDETPIEDLPLSKLELATDVRLKLFDRNHDGTLDRDEWAHEQQYLRGQERAANQVKDVTASAERRLATLGKYDLDHDDRLNDDELYQSLVDLNRQAVAPKPASDTHSVVRRRIVLPINEPDPPPFNAPILPKINHLPAEPGEKSAADESPPPRRRVVLPTNDAAAPIPTSIRTVPPSLGEQIKKYDLNADGKFDKAERAKMPVSLRVTLPSKEETP